MADIKLRFGEILVRAGLLDETHLKAALAEQKKWGGRLGRVLVDMGFVDEPTVVAALSRHLNIPAVDLEASPPPLDAAQLLPVQTCERYGVFPLMASADRKFLRLATSDPTNHEAFQQIEFRTGMKIEPVVASGTDIDRAIRRYYYGERPEMKEELPEAEAMELTPGRLDQETPPQSQPAPLQQPLPQPQAVAGSQRERDLVERVARLEELANRQARALRALVDLMVENRQLDRAAYVRKVRNE
ncbi:MAG: general secretion pathway protein GspE [Myxococcales bacterium]